MNDEELRRLLELGVTGTDPPTEMEKRIEAVALQEWRNLPSPTVRWRKAGLAIAASIALVAGFAWLAWFGPAAALTVGEIVYATGDYTIEDRHGDAPRVAAGATLQTHESGRVLVRIDSSTFLRVDRRSSLEFAGPGRLLLQRGRVFVDSSGGGVTLETEGGIRVSDVGTQFDVVVRNGEVEIGVREGRVDITLGAETVVAVAREGVGEIVVVDMEQTVSRIPVMATDGRWHWIHDATPVFELDAATVYDFLVWATREVGLELAFASEAARLRASRVTLHGSPVDANGLGRAVIGEILETVPSLHMVESAGHRLVVAHALPESLNPASHGEQGSGQQSETTTSSASSERR